MKRYCRMRAWCWRASAGRARDRDARQPLVHAAHPALSGEAGGVEGVVITFVDMTERKSVRDALEAAKRAPKPPTRPSRASSPPPATTCANRCKLWRCSGGCWIGGFRRQGAQIRCAHRRNPGAMTGMLNALLDINQIKAGAVRGEMAPFPVQGLLDQIARRIRLSRAGEGSRRAHGRMRPVDRSDPRLLNRCCAIF